LEDCNLSTAKRNPGSGTMHHDRCARLPASRRPMRSEAKQRLTDVRKRQARRTLQAAAQPHSFLDFDPIGLNRMKSDFLLSMIFSENRLPLFGIML
jgi:hypothetical protein